MRLPDYVLIGLTLAIFPFVKVIALGCRQKVSDIHQEVDLLGIVSTEFLNDLDKKFWSRWTIPVGLLLISFLAYPWIRWSALDPTFSLCYFIFFLSAIVTWKAITEDVDLALGNKLFKERFLMLFCLIGVFIYPGFLFPLFFLGIHYFKGWYHHQVMIWRLLQIFLAYLPSVVLMQLSDRVLKWPPLTFTAIPLLFLFLCMIASHYAGSGIKKLKLGKKWYSWSMDNRLHYLAAAAYMWGWQRDQNVEKRLQIIHLLKQGECFLQFGALGFECGWLFAGFGLFFTAALCVVGMVFHLLVFLSSGILFWQSIGTLGALLVWLLTLPSPDISELFNWQNGLLLSVIIFAFPLQNKLWDLNALAWWDTPFIGRVDWSVLGESGKEYGLYNDFMSPHERFFGRHYSLFLVPEKNFHRHLGEVFDLDLRNAIISSDGKGDVLKALKEKWGKYKRNEALESMHDLYMILFFENFNQGKIKKICPAVFKAPGGQYFYHGIKPPFKGQEKVKKIIVSFREEFFDGSAFKIVGEQKLKELDISL